MKVKALVIDVDGTLTDGGIYIGNNGEIMKKFYVKDGYAIHELLPQMGIIPIIITGRQSEIVSIRCQELGINRIVQGCSDKLLELKKIILEEQIAMEEVAYIGDDLNDFECMSQVGVKGCPNDAVDEIKKIADYVAEREGGKGAVREFIEWMKTQQV